MTSHSQYRPSLDHMDYKPTPTKPRVIIHGGAGNIRRDNLSPRSYKEYRNALLSILDAANTKLVSSGADALDVATYAVSLLEEHALFNAGRGAVYTAAGTHELEASVMVSRGYRKRGVGVMGLKKVKSPISLAREMLVRGELDDGGGAQGHCELHGNTADALAERWGLEQVKPSYFWTRRMWDQHRRGLGLSHDDDTYERMKRDADGEDNDCHTAPSARYSLCHVKEPASEFAVGDINWDGKEYLPQGTVGAVVLDSAGVLCVATSTGGITNKLPGRIGDTPTIGAGFWSEEFEEVRSALPGRTDPSPLSECLPFLVEYGLVSPYHSNKQAADRRTEARAFAMSGTGNGDSFLRVNAVRSAAAIARYSSQPMRGDHISLQQAVTAVAGPHGLLQHSAGDRWGKTGEGEGGIIGIELYRGQGRIAYDFNCGGMFHAWIDDDGQAQFQVFQDGPRPPPYV